MIRTSERQCEPLRLKVECTYGYSTCPRKYVRGDLMVTICDWFCKILFSDGAFAFIYISYTTLSLIINL